MNIIASIQKRRSVRSYTGASLSEDHVGQIRQYINALPPFMGQRARIEIIHAPTGAEPVKLGTYGWVKGAKDYLVLIYDEAPFAETAAAYLFEQVVLFCTGLGLGTCWLGGSFSRGDFKKQITLQPNERMKIVSPVGYAIDRKHFIEKYIVNADRHHASRKPFGELFFDRRFGLPLTQTQAGRLAQPLEMVRLAPSANNMQEWRAVLDGDTLHFYRKPFLTFDAIDVGIALCHFEQTCKQLNIDGRFEFLDERPEDDRVKYVISWKTTDFC